MEEPTEVIELQGKGLSLWRQKRINARADRLREYLDKHSGERFTQPELCAAMGLGTDAVHLREAVFELEHRGHLTVDRNKKPHRYLTKETT